MKLLVVGHPRSGTSLIARHLVTLGLRTVSDPRRGDYPAGYLEHLPALLFTKACERLRGWRDRLTDASLIEDAFLEMPAMRAMFEKAYAVFDDPDVDFVKLPDHALALEFMRRRFPHVRVLGVWRSPRTAMASYYRREFGDHPGFRGLYYAMASWNLYARRILAFHAAHPDAIDIAHVDTLVATNGSLGPLLQRRGLDCSDGPGIRQALGRPWVTRAGLLGATLAAMELPCRLQGGQHRPYFQTARHRRQLEAISQ